MYITGPSVPDEDRPQASLQRAKTTINVPSDARDRIRALNTAGSSPSSPVRDGGNNAAIADAALASASAGLARSATSASRNMPSGPMRGLSVRRPGGPAPPSLGIQGVGAAAAAGMSSSRSSPTSSGRKPEARLTEFYDDYLDSYGATEEVPPLPTTQRSPDRVANWARNNANPATSAGVQRSRSMAPPSSYAPSSAGGTLRRKTTRRTARTARSTYYEDEDEGYASLDYEEGPFEMTKIRVKVSAFKESLLIFFFYLNSFVCRFIIRTIHAVWL